MPQHGYQEIKKTKTFDGSDLSPKASETLKKIAERFRGNAFAMSGINDFEPDGRVLALTIMRLNKRGYLFYEEKDGEKMLQIVPEALKKMGIEVTLETPNLNPSPEEEEEMQEEIQIAPAMPKFLEERQVQATLAMPPKLEEDVGDELTKFANESLKTFDAEAVQRAKPIQKVQETFKKISNEQVDSSNQREETKKLIEKELTPLYQRMNDLSNNVVLMNKNISQLTHSLSVKKISPSEMAAEYRGTVTEILNNLKGITLEGTDESIFEVLKAYKEAKHDGNTFQEKEYAWNAIPRMESVMAWYLHLVVQMGRYIKYLEAITGANSGSSHGKTDEEMLNSREGE